MKTIKIALFLAIVTCLSGLSIGIINSLTAPVIEQNSIESEKATLELIFPNGEFNNIDYQDDEKIIIGAYEVSNKGYVFKANAKGYNSSNPIVVLIGMDQEGTILNIIPLEQQETNNIGTKCFEDENINKLYIGKSLSQEIDGITGATFTSNAMKTMIAKAQDAFRKVR